MTVDIRRCPRLGVEPLPSSVGNVGRMLADEEGVFFVAQLPSVD